MNVGSKIRHIRQMKNLSQENLATALGISQKSYSELENGKISITIDKLEEIAKILKVSMEDIFNYSTDKVFYYNNNTIENGYIENVNNLNKGLVQDLKEQHKIHVEDLKNQIEFLKGLLKK